MPSRKVLLTLLDLDGGRAAEIDSDKRSDIRNRVARARDEFAIGQHRVEPFEALERRVLRDLAVFPDLRDAALEESAGVAERRRRHRQDFEFHAAIPHLDDGLVLGVNAHQRRLWLDGFEIPANRDRLGDMGAVVEFEHRYPAHRIDLQEFGLAIFGSGDVDLHERNVGDAFFREKDAHAAWIRSSERVVYFHSGCNLKLSDAAVNL